MTAIERARTRIQGRGLSVVLPEGGDERIRAAAQRLVESDLARPLLIGGAAAGCTSIALSSLDSERLADTILAQRPGTTGAVARRLLGKPLYLGGALVAAGLADAMVAGVDAPTRRVIEAALMTIGPAHGLTTPSSFFLMTCPHAIGGSRTLLFADCAVNVDPTADELASIAIASAESARGLLNETPRIALLSFSTQGSAQHGRVSKVIRALERVGAQRPDIAIDGEFQGDAALIEAVAAKKTRGASDVAGRANVLVFPDLDAGNIAYKLVQYLGGATATGPFLQGFAKPVSDLSRGASVDDIVATVVVTLARSITD